MTTQNGRFCQGRKTQTIKNNWDLLMEVVAKDFYPHHALEEYCLCVRDHYVYKYYYATATFEKYFRIPPANDTFLGRLKDTIARSFIGRILNTSLGLTHVVELPSKTVIVIYDKVYRFNPIEHAKTKCAEVAFSLEEVGAMPPLRNGIGIQPISGDCFFSEYSNDPERPKSIFKICDDGRQIKRVYQFSKTEIKHVHSVTWDEYRERFWVTTGDSDEQSWFYYTEDNFDTLVKGFGGDQTWRAVSIIPTNQGLIWGMDAGKDATASDINYIYNLNIATGEREQVQQISAPAYHSVKTHNGMFVISTNYEPGCKQPIKPEAAVWASNDGYQWSKIYSVDYLSTPRVNGSMYAYIYSPQGCIADDHYLFTATNVASNAMTLIRLKIKK